MKFLYLIALCLFTSALAAQKKSQIKVVPQDAQEFTGDRIIKGLVSSGIKILDISTNFTPTSHVLGFFNDPVRYMGISQGMILSTGVVDNITRESSQQNYSSSEIELDGGASLILSNDVKTDTVKDETGAVVDGAFEGIIPDCLKTSGDVDLSNEIKGLSTFDARVIVIKFIPTADTFYYRYVFASEEYDEYVGSQFNDVFAFYIYEEGGKKVNTAMVPNQNLPVSINSINGGNPQNPFAQKTNPYLFQRNNGKQNLLFDGFTKVLDIRYKVVPGKVYYIKIAIADASDCVWDSAVLIENGSIFSYFKTYEMHFKSDSSIPVDPERIEEVVKYIEGHPGCKVQLIGHSDRPGSIDYNFELSIKRVEEVKRLLASKGVSPGNILETYKGESMPRYHEDFRNRRVEIFILGE